MNVSQKSNLGLICIFALKHHGCKIPENVIGSDHNIIVYKYGDFVGINLYNIHLSLKPSDKYYGEIRKGIKDTHDKESRV